jgi:hypothetical protein
MSPKERTHARLRELGYTVADTQHWHHYAKIRQDLFGFIDSLAVKKDHFLAVQTTDSSHHSAMVKKILSIPVAKLLNDYLDIEVWSWGLHLTGERRKDGLLNRRKEQTVRVTRFVLDENNQLTTKEIDPAWTEVPKIDYEKFHGPGQVHQ